MKTTIFLRIASIVALLQYSAHAVLFLSASPKHGAEEIALIETMKSHTWNFAGSIHSYWNFYFGYGLLAILWGLIEVVLLWQFATLSKPDPFRLRPVIFLIFIANIGHALLTLKYFFLLPAIFDFIIAALLGFAFIGAKKDMKI